MACLKAISLNCREKSIENAYRSIRMVFNVVKRLRIYFLLLVVTGLLSDSSCLIFFIIHLHEQRGLLEGMVSSYMYNKKEKK